MGNAMHGKLKYIQKVVIAEKKARQVYQQLKAKWSTDL